ncbi:MAG TPA: BREX system ATP-binding domain-containing protein [Candidatus Xenobia bacterium]|jgi:hypothetical protein
MSVELGEWLNLLEVEYLKDYVREGGSATKFVVLNDPGTVLRLLSDTRQRAEGAGYLVASIDAAVVKVQLLHQLFHSVARQIPWEVLSRNVVQRAYQEAGMKIHGSDLRIDAVAASNGVAPQFLRSEMRRALEAVLNRRSDMSKDFRYAMLWLCLQQIAPLPGNDAESLLQWLKGDLRLISTLKRLLIFHKIDRHNARAMLSSLAAWCRMGGYSGLLLQLDLRQLAVPRRQETDPDTVFYGTPALMDAFEVLRQLIDSTDDLPGMLTLVVMPDELIHDEKRGVKVYKALYERIWPDVRLKQRANPLSALADLQPVPMEVA